MIEVIVREMLTCYEAQWLLWCHFKGDITARIEELKVLRKMVWTLRESLPADAPGFTHQHLGSLERKICWALNDLGNQLRNQK